MPRIFQPVTRTIEASCQGTMDGQLVENKFYAQATTTVTAAMVQEIANIVESWLSVSLLPIINNTYIHTRTVARDISTPDSFEFVDTAHSGATGGRSGEGMPNNVTLAIHRDTGMSGKLSKSRIYIPALAEIVLSGPNEVGTTGVNECITVYNALRTAILAGTMGSYLYGYPQRIVNGAKLPVGKFVPVLSHSVTDNIVDSQRARLPGHGL